MYKVYNCCGDLVGLFCDEATRDRQIEQHGGSYKTIKVRSVKRLYKDMKGYDILMTAKELAKLVAYAGGSSSHYDDTELENAVSDFIDRYGDSADISKSNSMLTDIISIADNERQNAFALGFETAVSLILSRELT